MPLKDKHYGPWLESLPSLEGKTVAVTGTTSGLGYWAAVGMVRKKVSTLMLLNRDSSRSKDALEKLQAEKEKCGSSTEIIAIKCDLMSFDAVKEAAAEVNKICESKNGLNALINNAGIMAVNDDRSKDGYEVQMQVNHLSHFLLTKLVFKSLCKAYDAGEEVRVFHQTSLARNNFAGNLEEKYFEKSEPNTLGKNGMRAKYARYHMSKLSNINFTLMLHKKLQEKGYDVTRFKSVAGEPGLAETDLGRSRSAGKSSGLSKALNSIAMNLSVKIIGAHSGADGSLPLLEASFGENVQGGDFFYPEHSTYGKPYKAISNGSLTKGNKRKETMPLNEQNHEMMWKKTEEVCGSFFDEI